MSLAAVYRYVAQGTKATASGVFALCNAVIFAYVNGPSVCGVSIFDMSNDKVI
jgi:hypothetical protein